MFSRKFSGVVFTFWKKNSKNVAYVAATLTGLAGGYYVNKDAIFPEKQPLQAFSLFPDKIDLSDSLTAPVTDEEFLRANKDKMRCRMEAFITNLQGKIIKSLQEVEPEKKFAVDRWARKEGGGGITCIIEEGETWERAAVNISVVMGSLPPGAVHEMRARGKKSIPTGKELPFFACGISSVIHPRNPNVPTLHFNYRYFEVEVAPNQYEWWFGGGTDMTPYYLDEDDVKHFHKTLKQACDKHDKGHYERFKKWCDEYFWIKHRGVSRGIGGIFFDDVDQPSADKVFEFVKTCGNSVVPSYLPVVKKNMDKPYGLKEREWQLLRRGHYTEFNLVYDRGTKFGLMTPGSRIESILVSLPKTAVTIQKWSYKFEPEVGSPEHKLNEVLKKPKEWL